MKIFLLLLALFTIFSASARSVADSDTVRLRNNVRMPELKKMIVPLSLITLGVWGAGNDWFQAQSRDLAEEINENIDHKFSMDDYFQYVPMAASFALDWCGVKAEHCWQDRTIVLAMSYLMMGLSVNTMKTTFHEWRPDGTSHNSFP